MTLRRQIRKQRQERFTKSLTDARSILDDIIEKAEDGDEQVFDDLDIFNDVVERIYRQADRMENDDRGTRR